MTQVAISGFVNTWASAFNSTVQKVDADNVRQGGNQILAAFPLAMQATFASSVMGSVAAAVTGPFALLARFFQILFSPFLSFPLAIGSCAAKEGFYEESVKATAVEMTQFFEVSADISPDAVKGTVTLQVDGVERHFTLGGMIDWYVENTVLVDGKRHWFHRLRADEVFNESCREIEIDGERVQIKLEQEAYDCKFIERTEDGVKHYYELGAEAAAPVRGTISVRIPDDQIDWGRRDWRNIQLYRHHFLNRAANETSNGVKIQSAEKILYYDTGEEVSSPEPGSRTFLIDGVERHFTSATYKPYKSMGLSTGLNALTDRFLGVSLLPTRLSALAATGLAFVNQHMSEVVRMALVVSGAVLFYFGFTAMAVGALSAVVYETLDHDLGVIPHQVSLFMETWMPMISSMGLLIVGTTFSQILAAASLVMMIPSAQIWIHQKVSAVMRKAMIEIGDPLLSWFANRQGAGGRPPQLNDFIDSLRAYPSLEECEAPFEQRKVMGRAEIDELLNGADDAYELNPACFTKNIEPVLQLEKNTNFNVLMELWDARTDVWLRSYPLILNKLADDKRFIEFLQPRVPGARPFFFQYDSDNRLSRNEQQRAAMVRYKEDVDAWITTFAGGQNISKEQFAVNYVRGELQIYVEKLSGIRPIEGERWLLEEAIEDVSKIIPFLLARQAIPAPAPGAAAAPDATEEDPVIRYRMAQVDIENSLLHMGIDGGNYCALGMRRASGDVLEGFTEPLILAQLAQLPPSERFERELMREYQKARLIAMQGFYDEAVDFLRGSQQFQATAADIHLYTFVVTALKRGFYPLTDQEISRFSIPHLLFSETLLLPFRKMLKDRVIKHIPAAMRGMSVDRGHSFDGGPALTFEVESAPNRGGHPIYVDHVGRMLYLDNQNQNAPDVLQDQNRYYYVNEMVEGAPQPMIHGDRIAPSEENLMPIRLEAPHNKTLNYLRDWVQTNPQLSDLEKEDLLNGPLALSVEQLVDPSNHPKWNRLLLNILGIYRKKVVQPAAAAATAAANPNPPPLQLVEATA